MTWEDNLYSTKHIYFLKYQNSASGPYLIIRMKVPTDTDSQGPLLSVSITFPHQFVGSSVYGENKITVKFDDMDPIEYFAICSQDSGVVFEDKSLLREMLKHKKMLVRVQGYGTFDAVFNITSFADVISPYKSVYFKDLIIESE